MDHFRHIGILNRHPLILYSCIDSFVPFDHSLADLIADVTSEPFTLVLQIWQSWEQAMLDEPALIPAIAAAIHRHLSAHPAHGIWIACNTEAEVAIAQAHGLAARFLYQNAFVDETRYTVLPPASVPGPRYTALYLAQMWDRKRHELAADIASIALVYALHAGAHAHQRLAQVKAIMPGAFFANEHPAPGAPAAHGSYRYLPPAEICALMNRCQVGLALSAHEGASLCTVEYLLSGLPVVSTPSRGGRDAIFADPYALVADPTPAAIAQATAAMAARRLSRWDVRRATLRRLASSRGEWRGFIASVCAAMGHPEGNRFAADFRAIRREWCGMPIKSVRRLGSVLHEGPSEV